MMIVSGPSVTNLEGLESLKVAATYIRVEDTQITGGSHCLLPPETARSQRQVRISRIIAIKEGKPALSIYPNPVKGQLRIKTSNRGQAFDLKDKTGLTVLESSVLPTNGIDTSHLQTGLYYLSVGEDVFKVVVQH